MTSSKAILGDYLEFVTYGFTNPMPDADVGPWKITAKDVINGEINFSTARKTTQKAFNEKLTEKSRPRIGDVLLTKDGTLGRLAIVKQEGICINQSVAVLRPNGKILPEYLFYLLTAPVYQRRMIGDADGAVIKHIYITRLDKMKVDIPTLDIQKKRIKHLLALDRKIKINTQTQQTLESMAQAIFKSWFVDFDPVKAKITAKDEGRDPLRAAMSVISGKSYVEIDAMSREQFDQLATIAALFPDEMEYSELGEIPKGWSVSKVESLLLRLPAKTRYTKDQVLEYGQTPVFEQGTSILLGYHDKSATYQACIEEPAFIFGDHTCVTRLSCQPFDISQNVIPLRGRDRATTWVYYAVKEKQKFQEYRRHWMELISKDVVIATADACLEFSKKVSILHLEMEENERQINRLRELRDTLLPKLISGELPVTEDITGGDT